MTAKREQRESALGDGHCHRVHYLSLSAPAVVVICVSLGFGQEGDHQDYAK